MNLAPKVSIVIPTRNRGDRVKATIESIIENRYPNFDIVLVDQSIGDETEQAINSYKNNPSFQYLRSASQGAGLARNIGLEMVTCDYILFTDDDCTVPLDWIEKMVSTLEQDPCVALVFCSVTPGPYDSGKGVVPNCIYQKNRIITNVREYYKSIGMSAGLAARHQMLVELGGFDKHLGAGSLFRAGEDHDLAVRSLLAGWKVIETPNTEVVHHGFRTFSEFRELTERDWFGLGAAEAKHLKCGYPQILYLVTYNLMVQGLWNPFSNVFRLKKPTGFRRFHHFLKGFLRAYKTEVDRWKVLFVIESK